LGLLAQNPQSCIHKFWFACFAHPSTTFLSPSFSCACLHIHLLLLLLLLITVACSNHQLLNKNVPCALVSPNTLVSWYKPSVGWVFESTPNTLLVSTWVYRNITVEF
jgi:hypothetical protein